MRKLVSGTLGSKVVLQQQAIAGKSLRRYFGTMNHGGPIAFPFETAVGCLYLYIAQELEVVEQNDGSFRLRTRRYWYRLQPGPSLSEQAHLRWEYDSDAAHDGPSRHHVQMRAVVDVGGRSLDFNKLHIPTGWVLIEQVIRFMLVDLRIKAASTDWPSLLASSERMFFEDFSGKRYTPPL